MIQAKTSFNYKYKISVLTYITKASKIMLEAHLLKENILSNKK